MKTVATFGAFCSILLAMLLAPCSLRAALSVDNLAPTNIARTTAFMSANILATNGTTNALSLILYYGTADRSTNAGSWAHSLTSSPYTLGSYSTNIAGLSPASPYYYRFHLAEGTSTTWAAASTSFWTLAGVPTGSPPAAASVPVMVDTNGNIVSPTNLLDRNYIARLTDIANSVTGTPGVVEETYNGVTRLDAHNLGITIRTNYVFIPPTNSILVTGSLSPDATGLYLPFGDYFGASKWRRADGTYYIYHNHGGPDWYILSPELPAGGVSWVFTTGAHPPIGDWTENNGVSGIATSSFAPRILDLTGVTVVPATNVYHFIGPGFTNSITATASNFVFSITGSVTTNGYWP